MRAAVVVTTTVLAVLSLAGCGEESSGADDVRGADDPTTVASDPATTPTETPAAAAPPACDVVWTAGATLPGDYEGCSDESGDYLTHTATYCESGQSIFAFDDRAYATPGGVVVFAKETLASDPAYRRAIAGFTA